MQLIAYRQQPAALDAVPFDFEIAQSRRADTYVGLTCFLVALGCFAGWLK